MSKYPLMPVHGLKDIALRGDWYTPGGNRWTVVNNGLLGGQLLYDPKTRKVYGLALREVTDIADSEFLEQCEGEVAQQNVQARMNYAQAKEWLEQHP